MCRLRRSRTGHDLCGIFADPKFKNAVRVPILANMTEFGHTPLYTKDELTGAGIDVILCPCAAYRARDAATLEVNESIRAKGTQRDVVPAMQTTAEPYEFLGYHDCEQKLDKLFAKGKQL